MSTCVNEHTSRSANEREVLLLDEAIDSYTGKQEPPPDSLGEREPLMMMVKIVSTDTETLGCFVSVDQLIGWALGRDGKGEP